MEIIQIIAALILFTVIIYTGIKAVKNIYQSGSVNYLWSWLLVIFIGK